MRWAMTSLSVCELNSNPAACSSPAQPGVVLDDAVVHDGDLVTRRVGMRIVLARRAVRRPAGVRDPHRRAQTVLVEHRLQPLDLSQAPKPLEPAAAHDGQPRRIVAAILQAPQTLHENGDHVTLGYRAYDSAHRALSSAAVTDGIIAKAAWAMVDPALT